MTTPRQFRLKPTPPATTIEAAQLTFDNQAQVMAWCGGRYWSRPPTRAITGILLPTPEGDTPVPYGDWIAKHPDGTFQHLTQEQMEAYEPLDAIPTNEEAATYRAWWQQADREARDWKHRCQERAITERELRARIQELESALEQARAHPTSPAED